MIFASQVAGALATLPVEASEWRFVHSDVAHEPLLDVTEVVASNPAMAQEAQPAMLSS